jgi:hypothetical protein
MKLLTPQVHGYIDYLVVTTFFTAPNIFGFAILAATLSYIIALSHFFMTVMTDFPLGVLRLIPFPVHGTLELIISGVLVALPWLLGFNKDIRARNFYVGSGLSVFGVWLLTDYKGIKVQAVGVSPDGKSSEKNQVPIGKQNHHSIEHGSESRHTIVARLNRLFHLSSE